MFSNFHKTKHKIKIKWHPSHTTEITLSDNLNDAADKLANININDQQNNKYCRHNHQYISSLDSLKWKNFYITSKIPVIIERIITKNNMHHYIQNKFKWSNQKIRTIAWS